ncbi:MAG: type IV pilus modification PilV family protein, partial [Bdellovibrionota bacterium]
MDFARGERGSTIVESLIAFALFAMTAIAVYPIFFTAKKQSKSGDSRQLCESLVHGKLDEYRYGHVTNIADAAAGTGEYTGLPARGQLSKLTVDTLSDTSINLASTDSGGVGGAIASGGFLYSKVRYNRYWPFSCSGTSNATILQPAKWAGIRGLGMRECVGRNVAWDDQTVPAAPCANSAEDTRIAGLMPGFKLYVKLELTSPWLVAPVGAGNVTTIAGGSAAQNAQFSNQCPDFGSWVGPSNPGAAPLYDFDGAGDGIKVTVTGVVDIASQNGQTDFAGSSTQDPTRLMCTASAIVQPPATPVRYYLSPDGRIYSIHGHGQNGNEQGGWVFQSIYGLGTTDTMKSGIMSFAVHPRNLSIYVLRLGTVVRYSNCGGVPIDCDPTSGAFGLSDGIAGKPTAGAWEASQEFQVPSSIAMIAVDFRSGAVYGMTADKSDVIQLNFNNATLAECNGACSGIATTPAMATANTVAANAFPRPIPAGAIRLTGFFISPDGDSAFVSDRSASSFNNSSYTSMIYRNT